MNRYPGYPYYGYEKTCKELPLTFPPQKQEKQPGLEYLMVPLPISDNPSLAGSGKLKGKAAIVTGGDSGIGKAAVIGFAKEGANIVISYLYEEEDAKRAKADAEKYGAKCCLFPGDLREEETCRLLIEKTIEVFGRLDIFVMNQAVQFPQESIVNITKEQLKTTFETNVYPMFYMTKAALPHLKRGSSLIITTSVTAYKGNPLLLDYSSSKGALVTFIRSLSAQLADQGIRVNGVAPGPVWTPLTVSSYQPPYVSRFGRDTPMKRPAQPFELAPTYIYLAADDSQYVTGQILHVNGGTITSY
ncbi:SDR family oxidoreductase [Metabacillus sp. GX 13764]|uniref:SDR family oxidoreductase n=1 Tax=Metabacillus kandeliae TaxID=2900151 RepID=UPI001E61522F|nr:SDR family oxidoreductase [Metabacillus kandeliae]MCD7035794.1 SDR family oxidoreductase [Metabacillus kandeliae]